MCIRDRHKNSQKFISLFRVSEELKATLYLVNYAKAGTKHEDKVKVIKVIDIDEKVGITKEQVHEFNRKDFADWFRKLNAECRQ